MKSLVSFKKPIILFLFVAFAVFTCLGLASCKSKKESDIESIIKAQNKTESLREFGMNLSTSIESMRGFVSVAKETNVQYICYGTGENRRVYTDTDGRKAYCVGNSLFTFSGNKCDSCRIVDDSEIYKKPFESEELSDFDGAEVSCSDDDGKRVYTVTLTEDIVLKQLGEVEAELPPDVEIRLNDEYKVKYTVDKKTGYLVEYDIPLCAVTYVVDGVDHTVFLKSRFSVVTDVNDLKIDYPETFEEYEKFYAAESCFIGVEKYENSPALVNSLEGKSEHEKVYTVDDVSEWGCDGNTGAVAVSYSGNETDTVSCVDVYDKDMKKTSTFSFYGTVTSLSMENGKLAVVVSKKQIGKDNKFAKSIYAFDLTDNSKVFECSPADDLNWKVTLYGNVLAYYTRMSSGGLYIYNFSSKKTFSPALLAYDYISGVVKTADGKLSVLLDVTVFDNSRRLVFEIDEEGVAAQKYKMLQPYSLKFNGTYWYSSSHGYFVNAKEEVSSLGVENFHGTEINDNTEVIYYDGQTALVFVDRYKLWVCDLKREEYVYCCTNLRDETYYKAGENCLCYVSGNWIYKLDLSSLVAE